MRTRARSEEAKALRRRTILDAAARVWASSTFDEFTMAEVARRARLAKGTLYLYFPTKEALLLELLERRLDRALGALEARLEGSEALGGPDAAARLIASMLVADDDLVRLLMILGAILEHNLPDERIRGFKIWLHRRVARAGATLERHLPSVERWGGVKLLVHLQALVTGLGQLARPAAAVARVLSEPELEALRVDFETELGDALAALMHGSSLAMAATPRRRAAAPAGRDR